MSRCDSYTWGNCTRGACELAPWVPDGLGDGGDWAADYRAQGGQVTMVPTPGSVVCYCRGDGYSQFGHVGYVLQVYPDGTFLVREMNFIAFDQLDDRVSTMADVCGFLLPPGGTPGSGGNLTGGGPGGGLDDVRGAWSEVQGLLNDALPDHVRRVNAVGLALGGF